MRLGTQPRRRLHVAGLVLVLLVVLIAVVAFRNFSASGGSTVYRLSGTAERVSITYESASGTSEQLDNVELPWELARTADPTDLLYVSAVNKAETGNITCEIVHNGDIINQTTVEGAYAVATCTTMLP